MSVEDTNELQSHSKEEELNAIYLVLDSIIGLGLGDRGLPKRK